jgi:hypothetical protein
VTKTGSKIWRYRHKNYAGSLTMKALETYPNTTLEQAIKAMRAPKTNNSLKDE